jgi:SOS-response transcriptional repressor LexA
MLCENCRSKINVPRTQRQAEILEYYLDFRQRRGFLPSYAMIARHIGVRSKATIAKHMAALKRQGFIKEGTP